MPSGALRSASSPRPFPTVRSAPPAKPLPPALPRNLSTRLVRITSGPLLPIAGRATARAGLHDRGRRLLRDLPDRRTHQRPPRRPVCGEGPKEGSATKEMAWIRQGGMVAPSPPLLVRCTCSATKEMTLPVDQGCSISLVVHHLVHNLATKEMALQGRSDMAVHHLFQSTARVLTCSAAKEMTREVD